MLKYTSVEAAEITGQCLHERVNQRGQYNGEERLSFALGCSPGIRTGENDLETGSGT